MTSLRWPSGGVVAQVELEIKKSRFLGFAERADSEVAAREQIGRRRAEFPDARHHCAAFVIWQPDMAPIQHSSDDGEPSGTAGRPMLDVLTGSGLTNCCAVVVRYFGGTLLGTGGLVRAYSETVQAVIGELPTVAVTRAGLWELAVPYTHAGRVEAELRARQGLFTVLDVEHRLDGQVLRFAATNLEPLQVAVAETTHGTGALLPAGTTMQETPQPASK